jgi:hypothetical protein
MLALWGDFRLIDGYRRDALSATRPALTAYAGDQDPGSVRKGHEGLVRARHLGVRVPGVPRGPHTSTWRMGCDVLAHLVSRLVAS